MVVDLVHHQQSKDSSTSLIAESFELIHSTDIFIHPKMLDNFIAR